MVYECEECGQPILDNEKLSIESYLHLIRDGIDTTNSKLFDTNAHLQGITFELATFINLFGKKIDESNAKLQIIVDIMKNQQDQKNREMEKVMISNIHDNLYGSIHETLQGVPIKKIEIEKRIMVETPLKKLHIKSEIQKLKLSLNSDQYLRQDSRLDHVATILTLISESL